MVGEITLWLEIPEIFRCKTNEVLCLVWDGGEIGPRLVGNPQGSLRHFLHCRNSQKVGLDIIWFMQLATFYKEMDIFVIYSHIVGPKLLKKQWLCERCLNILNHDLECKFCAQIHIDVAELPIMKHLSFLKLANVPKIKPSRIPQHFLWQNIRFDLDCVQVRKNTFSETILEDMA